MFFRYLMLSICCPVFLAAQSASDFDANVLIGCAPLSVRFGAINVQNFSTVYWDMNNDGISDDSSAVTSVYIYTKPGIYSVKLSWKDADGHNYTILKENFIRVTQPPFIEPISSFEVCAGTAMQILPGITGGVRPFSYELTATGLSTIIRDSVPEFIADSTRTWKFIVRDSLGCSAERQFQLRVLPKPPKPDIEKIDRYISTTAKAESYQWYRNGHLVSGATNSNYLVLFDMGFYQIEVGDTNGCRNISDSLLVNEPVIGSVMAQQPQGWQIYPNPVVNRLQLQRIQQGSRAELYLDNAFGVRMLAWHLEAQEGEYQLDMSGLPSGMYILTIRYNQQQQFYKLLKE